MANTFPKAARVTSKKEIEKIFSEAVAIRQKSLVLRYYFAEINEDKVPVRVLFIVPKRRFKLAVTRNRIKRQLREIYRTNKSQVEKMAIESNKVLILGVLYLGHPDPRFASLRENFLLAVEKLNKRLVNNN
ncbi:MAG TPA: ribonuclease P protein component [Cryomorphaceae bacterium]|nr:ribonuclease P protein component [Cryomorphaceae bacterium]